MPGPWLGPRVFLPLSVIWPEAHIPVVAVSLKQNLDPQEPIDFGKALAPLRDENILVIGSGMSIHDLTFTVSAHNAMAFDNWLEHTMHLPAKMREAELCHWKQAPGGVASHPREEHLIRLTVTVGAGGTDKVTRTYKGDLSELPVAAYSFN